MPRKPLTMLPGYLYGIRSWDLACRRGRIELESVGQQYTWPRGESRRAKCMQRRHKAPAHNCECGFYAYHPTSWAGERLSSRMRNSDHYSYSLAVAGVVEAWGRIELHATGFRAEHCRVHAFATFEWGDEVYTSMVEALAAAHGVEAICVPEGPDLAYECLHRGLGLTAAVVERLLPSEPIRLVRSTADASCGAGARFGYWLEDAEGPDSDRDLEWSLGPPGTRVVRVDLFASELERLRELVFAPGAELALFAEPGRDRCLAAVAVYDIEGRTAIGTIPSPVASEISQELAAGHIASALSLCQWRDSWSGEPNGLAILLCSPRAEERLTFNDAVPIQVDEGIPF